MLLRFPELTQHTGAPTWGEGEGPCNTGKRTIAYAMLNSAVEEIKRKGNMNTGIISMTSESNPRGVCTARDIQYAELPAYEVHGSNNKGSSHSSSSAGSQSSVIVSKGVGLEYPMRKSVRRDKFQTNGRRWHGRGSR